MSFIDLERFFSIVSFIRSVLYRRFHCIHMLVGQEELPAEFPVHSRNKEILS